MYDKVIRTPDGYYELKQKPSPEQLQEYYSKKYYQDPDSSSYQQDYSDDEIAYFRNKQEQHNLLFREVLPEHTTAPSLLDVGCGEGWTLTHFKEKGWPVTGLDYSAFGCKKFNPGCLADLITGDIYQNLDRLIAENKQYDVIILDNVLEHVLDPYSLLTSLTGLCLPDGLLLVDVPNDFSALQEELVKTGRISDPFWVVEPDHISYFNRDGLENLCRRAGWKPRKVIADFPIDLNLFNDAADYITDRAKGKAAHTARVLTENFLHGLSPEKTNRLYSALADLGLGRSIIGIFNKQ